MAWLPTTQHRPLRASQEPRPPRRPGWVPAPGAAAAWPRSPRTPSHSAEEPLQVTVDVPLDRGVARAPWPGRPSSRRTTGARGLGRRGGRPEPRRRPAPARPRCAIANARSRTSARSRTRVARVAHLTWGLISAIWSMSWSEPRPRSMVAVAPPRSTTGDCAICAFLTAVIVLVTPGPAVTAATPGMPVRRATASAAKTAFASSRTSTTRIPRALAETRIGEMWPPHSVKRKGTPCFWRTSAIRSPPVMRLKCYRKYSGCAVRGYGRPERRDSLPTRGRGVWGVRRSTPQINEGGVTRRWHRILPGCRPPSSIRSISRTATAPPRCGPSGTTGP